MLLVVGAVEIVVLGAVVLVFEALLVIVPVAVPPVAELPGISTQM